MKTIYQIICCCGEIYVGKTNSIRHRTYYHKNACSNVKNVGYNIKVYKHFRDCGMTGDDIELIPIEHIEDDDVMREFEVIKEVGATLNAQLGEKYNEHYHRDRSRNLKITNPEKWKEKKDRANRASKLKRLEETPQEKRARIDRRNKVDNLRKSKNKVIS